MESDPEQNSLIFRFALILFLTAVNAFFASAEMAMVSLNRNRLTSLAKKGNKKAVLLEKLLSEPTKFLSTIQVGITLAGFFSSASAATGISGVFGEFLGGLGIPYGTQIAFVVVTVLLSYVTLVFGELYPKRLALQNSEKIAMFSVKPIMVVYKIAMPFVKLLSISTSLLIRLTGMETKGLEEKVSREEIRSLIGVGQEHGVINETEREMIDSIFRFDDKIAKTVMTPRTEVFMLDLDMPYSDYVDSIVGEKHSRIPIYRGDIDNIIGILNLKDFLTEAYELGFENVDIEKIMRPPYFVPERKYIDDLFKELQASSTHIAVLIDEYGGFSGIVTVEDLLEEIVGEIYDEFDEEDTNIKKISESEYLIRGLATVEDLNELLHLNLNEDSEEYDTLGGLLLHLIEYIPEPGEKKAVEYKNLLFDIALVKDNRIELVKLTILPDSDSKESTEEKSPTE